VNASKVDTAEKFNRQLEAAIYSPSPFLIEVEL